MFEAGDKRIIELRERAKHYRQLALGPMPWALAQQLDRFAQEYDEEVLALLAQCQATLKKRATHSESVPIMMLVRASAAAFSADALAAMHRAAGTRVSSCRLALTALGSRPSSAK